MAAASAVNDARGLWVPAGKGPGPFQGPAPFPIQRRDGLPVYGSLAV